MREELSGMDSSLWTLAEPLKGGLKKSLLTVMLNLMMKGGAQLVNYDGFFCSHPYLQPYFQTQCASHCCLLDMLSVYLAAGEVGSEFV